MYLLHHMASFMKPVSGKMNTEDGLVEKDFYQESEWRFVPHHSELPQFLSKPEFMDKEILAINNQKARDVAMLRFSPLDVRYIFVQSDSEIPQMINFIQSALDMHPAAETKVLMSRVTSLETLRNDW